MNRHRYAQYIPAVDQALEVLRAQFKRAMVQGYGESSDSQRTAAVLAAVRTAWIDGQTVTATLNELDPLIRALQPPEAVLARSALESLNAWHEELCSDPT
jgi:hypothetical protein